MLICHLYIFFGELSVQIPCLFFLTRRFVFYHLVLRVLYILSEYKSFFRHIIYKYFLLVYDFSFHSFKKIFFNLIYFFIQQVLISHQFYTHQCIHVNPNHPIHHTTIPTPPRLSPLGVHTFVLYICVSTSALQTRSSVPFFYVPHTCVTIQYLFFSF